MGGQLDGNFLPGSLPHKFILIVTSIICFVVSKFFSLFHPFLHSNSPQRRQCAKYTTTLITASLSVSGIQHCDLIIWSFIFVFFVSAASKQIDYSRQERADKFKVNTNYRLR